MVFYLKVSEDQGIKEIIRVVETKSDEDQEDVTRAKERYGKEHLENANNQLRANNPFDLPEDYRGNAYQHYHFDLLRPEKYGIWFDNIKRGILQ